ncbi:MAG: hypothetical protein H6700_03970 [Myxococcales bacterium]|nr:hypothetical protein [Myxococcales bacterium]MCB9530900.1 hypothetical protein [Myxococcales bacterium]
MSARKWIFSLSLVGAVAAGCGADEEHRADAGPTTDTGDGDVDGGADATDTADAADGTDVGDDGDTTADGTGDAAADIDATETTDAGPGACRPSDPSTPEAHAVGAWTVWVDPSDGAWSVGHDAPTLSAPPACVDGVASVRISTGYPETQNEFGAFRFRTGTRLSTLAWNDVAGAPEISVSSDGVALAYSTLGGNGVELRFSADGENLRVELASADAVVTGGSVALRAGGSEAFFGLGSQATGMNLRGRSFPLWTQEQGNGKPEDPIAWPLQNSPEAAYAPAGVWYSSAGYAAIVTHDAYSELDLRTDTPSLTSIGALPGFVLVEGETPKERLAAITEYTGRPTLPPAWVLAPWNDAVGGPTRLHAVAELLRSEGIPSSAIWSEDWIGGEQSGTGYRLSYAWEWSPEQYPDLAGDIEWLHARGFAFLAYFNPFVPSTTRMWTEGNDQGFLAARADGTVRTIVDPAFRTAGLVELTNPDAVEWVRDYMQGAAEELGIDGWMCDFSEWYPVDAAPVDGSSAWTVHNRYPLLWQAANRDALARAHADSEGDWTFFSRAGWASVNGGAGAISPVHWAGDQNTDWGNDDGIPTVPRIGANLGLTGVTLFGSDVAGYNSVGRPNTTKELFYRWTALGAFSPVMRTHHGSDECGNWSFDRDAESLDHYRRYARIHTLLFPYLWSAVEEASALGLPVLRHVYLVEPDAAPLWAEGVDEFFLGDDLLVAAVLAEGATSRAAVLPSAGWWPLFGDAPLEATADTDGTVRLDADAPATEIPVFVRPGTILELLESAPDTFFGEPTDESSTSLLDVTGRRLALYPAADGSAASAAGDVEFTATGWTTTGWTRPSIEGIEIPDCDPLGAPCLDRTSGSVLVQGDATIDDSGDRSVSIVGGSSETLWRVGFAGAAWGAVRDVPATPDLAAVVPPPCSSR